MSSNARDDRRGGTGTGHAQFAMRDRGRPCANRREVDTEGFPAKIGRHAKTGQLATMLSAPTVLHADLSLGSFTLAVSPNLAVCQFLHQLHRLDNSLYFRLLCENWQTGTGCELPGACLSEQELKLREKASFARPWNIDRAKNVKTASGGMRTILSVWSAATTRKPT